MDVLAAVAFAAGVASGCVLRNRSAAGRFHAEPQAAGVNGPFALMNEEVAVRRQPLAPRIEPALEAAAPRG
jgi:hypothetical protein